MIKLLIFATLFTIFVVPLKVRADIFISNGTTLYFNETSPLEQYADIKEIRKHLVGFEAEPCFDCYSSFYSAEWTVIENELYLTGIYSSNSKNLKADLNSLFGVNDGKVKADWVTADLWLNNRRPMGFTDIMAPFFKSETYVSILKGQIKTIKVYNYPNAQESPYLRNQKARNEFIYRTIDWSKIPDLKDQVLSVTIFFETGTSGKPENMKIFSRHGDTLYHVEALRVVGVMPCSVYYKHGEVYKVQ